MSGFRRQPPAYAPLPPAALRLGVATLLRTRPDCRAHLAATLRADYGAVTATLCHSGTEALRLAIEAARRVAGPDARVALPAYSCFAVASAAVGANASVLLYDVNPATLAPDFESLEGALKEGARVVVVSPLFGIPVDWGLVEACLAPHGAVAIEDAAQGHGAAWEGRPLGSLGSLSVLSFGRGKGWTGGGGGVLLLRGAAAESQDAATTLAEPGLRAEARVVSVAHAQWLLGRPNLYWAPASLPWLGLGETRYVEPRVPRAMTRTAAAILEGARASAVEEAERRRANAAALLSRIPSGPGLRHVVLSHRGRPGFLRLPVRVRDRLRGLATRVDAVRLGVAPGYPHSLHLIPQVQNRMARRRDHWPGAQELSAELVTLPSHSLLGEGDRAQLVDLVCGGGSGP